MSHANGQVRFTDGTVLYYEYNGTCDIVCNCLYENYQEMTLNWRNQPHNHCTCDSDESVEIATDYGYGFFWDGKACKKCKAITDGLGSGVDDYKQETKGLPKWWK